MARTATHLLLKWRRPVDARQVIWVAIRARSTPFTTAMLAQQARLNETTVRTYLRALAAGGILSIESGDAPSVYALARDVGHRAPRLRNDGTPVEMGRGRQAAWIGMRIQKRFTARDLHLSTGIAISDAKSYCQYLAKAGYLRVADKGGPGKLATYMLDPRRDSGPLAPQVTRVRCIYDPNTQSIVWPGPDVEAEMQIEGARP
jgi:hypothetical protein